MAWLNALKKYDGVEEIYHNGKQIYRHRKYTTKKSDTHISFKFRDKTLSPLLRELLKKVDSHQKSELVFGDNFTEWRSRMLTEAKRIAKPGEIGITHQELMENTLIQWLANNINK
tara:strand:+ start:566 stop:910 length:345 start_codon:yes stop_codon:yes gene_type:complete